MQTNIDFKHRLSDLKAQIDAVLLVHSKDLKNKTRHDYTAYSAVVVDAYDQVLARGGKRIRGALTVLGYEMCGGKDTAMILNAAAAIEMTHAYILVLDDIMDKSAMRRGGESAHTILANYHRQHGLSGDSYHFGEAAAINSALIGCHYAQSIVTSLDVSSDSKIHALRLLNDALVVTGHGQINDIFNEVVDAVDDRAVNQVLEWKTAHYTFLNPLQFGMALAGADTSTLESIYDYCMFAGKAFQITDDILGTFSSELEAGKSPMDDIREGKRTVLSVAALHGANSADKNFLIQMLGNEKLTQAEFTRCKEIFVETGALKKSQEQAAVLVEKAKKSLIDQAHTISEEGIGFLSQLADSLVGRSA
jgi:geranylgeranyl diphosphate synthase type I